MIAGLVLFFVVVLAVIYIEVLGDIVWFLVGLSILGFIVQALFNYIKRHNGTY